MARTAPTQPVRLLDVDLADAAIVVEEHPDGAYTLDVSDTRLVLTPDQLQVIIGAFLQLGKTKGWT
jgi:hypothetical protein